MRDAIRRRAARAFLANAQRVAEAKIPPMSEEEIQAEIDVVRKARRVRVVADTNTIVSGDAHLLNLKSFHRMPIVTATEALARIGKATPGN